MRKKVIRVCLRRGFRAIAWKSASEFVRIRERRVGFGFLVLAFADAPPPASSMLLVGFMSNGICFFSSPSYIYDVQDSKDFFFILFYLFKFKFCFAMFLLLLLNFRWLKRDSNFHDVFDLSLDSHTVLWKN